MKFSKTGAFILAVASAQLGPGSGPWEVVSPESEGLSAAALADADQATDRDMGNRVCFLVAKNGKIVHERYMRGATQSSTRAAWSVTKSLCSSLFGIAQEQGFLATTDPVTKAGGTRLCNNDATFEHVLTMTGTSNNINDPRYSYDTLGTNCLDTISDALAANNGEFPGSAAWMRKYYFDVLGMEHTNWGTLGPNVACGFGADTSCRDLLRAGQLWTNNGEWAGAGQIMARDFAQRGVTPVFPNSGNNYGYTLPLRPTDPVDNRRGEMNGMNAQCVLFSAEHNTVIVTMGNGGSCNRAWENTRSAIVSRDHALYNTTRDLKEASPALVAEEDAEIEAKLREEVLRLAPYVAEYAERLGLEDLAQFNELNVRFGGKPILHKITA